MLMFLGSSVCHQLAERSYFYEDVQMPLCARCIGIQFGFAVSFFFLMTGSRRFASGLPSVRQMVALSAVMSLFLVDAVLSYSGLSYSTNLRRTLSGLCLGVVIPFILVPLLNLLLYPGRNPRRVLDVRSTWFFIGAIYVVSAALILLSEESWAIFYPVSIVGVMGVFMFFSTVASLEVMLILDKRPMSGVRKLAIGISIAVFVLLVMAVVHQMVSPTL